MTREDIIKEYAKLGITSQTSLYSYMSLNKSAVIGDMECDLNNSNEAMEFAATFLEAFGFDVKRFYLESEDGENYYWFFVFSNGMKWFFYETNLKDVKGQYAFKTSPNLITFAAIKIIKSLERLKKNDLNVITSYSLRKIEPLEGFDLYDDIEASREAKELLVWDRLKSISAGRLLRKIKVIEKGEVKSNEKKVHSMAFGIGFVATILLGFLFVWLLAKYYGNI